jgi:hypothetical protein
MNRIVAAEVGDRKVVLLDSITWVGACDAGQLVISGSHGGRSAGAYAIEFPLALCCFNDAGVGKDRAGIEALDMLDRRGIPALAVHHTSARIGDACDTWENGIVSHVNARAAALGFAPGLGLRDAIERIFAAP